MITHIVMWKFKDGTEKEQSQFLEGLQSLKDKIKEIVEMEVATSMGDDNEYDAILVSKFSSLEDLQSYKKNPMHVEVSSLCKGIRVSRVAFDYES